ncbi:sigma factor-like helix-turn-helix DNA-binding protein [Nonomuraea salmonea]|uniref:sigma factor-like helix-turn-helix DNA-binding protein n=1 Tax=Nonomuraea salmonea TaxID=46181 RepID=UPI003CD085CD
MTPAERVAFILHDVFRYPFAEVAEIVGRTPAACRQLASSARRRITAAQPPETSNAQRAGVVRTFKRAWESQDIAALIGILDPAATLTADGGGLVPAVLEPIRGAAAIARYALELTEMIPALSLAERMVNGRPGLVTEREGRTVAVMAFEVAGGTASRTSGPYATPPQTPRLDPRALMGQRRRPSKKIVVMRTASSFHPAVARIPQTAPSARSTVRPPTPSRSVPAATPRLKQPIESLRHLRTSVVEDRRIGRHDALQRHGHALAHRRVLHEQQQEPPQGLLGGVPA